MNAYEFLVLLGWKTVLLSVTAIGVGLLLLVCRSPNIHRTAWCCVLLLGLFGFGITVPIKTVVHVQKPVVSPLPPPHPRLAREPQVPAQHDFQTERRRNLRFAG